MAINTEKNTYTLLFAIGLVVVVGTLLAAIDSSLKDKIRINKILEKQQNILYAIGINENEGNSVNFIAAEKAEKEFNKYITKQIYIQGDQVIEDDKAYLIDVKKQKALAKDPSHKRKLPLFIADTQGNFKGVTVSKTNLDPKNEDKYDNEVDAIAGSTITGDGVTAMIRSDLSLYQPYFNSLNN